MQVKIEVAELTQREYFSTTADSIFGGRGNGAKILLVRVPGAGFCLALLIPPEDYCWGMQFRHSRHLNDWVERTITDSRVASEYRRTLDQLGIDPAFVPETLAGSGVFGQNSELAIGTDEPDLPRAWARSVLLPDTKDALESLLLRLREHIEQLGAFFLLPQPRMKRTALVSWSESVHRDFDVLFGFDHNPRTSAGLFAERKIALEKAIESVTSAVAQTWLTPRFLDWDLIRPDYPIADAPWKTKRTESWASIFSLRSAEDLHNEKKTISLLRVQLMKKWKWPVGVTMLAKHQEDQDYRNVMLRGGQPWQEIEAEVSEFLDEARSRYPILFS